MHVAYICHVAWWWCSQCSNIAGSYIAGNSSLVVTGNRDYGCNSFQLHHAAPAIATAACAYFLITADLSTLPYAANVLEQLCPPANSNACLMVPTAVCSAEFSQPPQQSRTPQPLAVNWAAILDQPFEGLQLALLHRCHGYTEVQGAAVWLGAEPLQHLYTAHPCCTPGAKAAGQGHHTLGWHSCTCAVQQQ